MHTNLSKLKKLLYNSVLDQSYKHLLMDGQSNQRAFLMAFLPLEFLRMEDNRSIIEIRSNNSSRLSNIFNRVKAPKRNEERFRQRFMEAFDLEFYRKMIESSVFLLRNYNKENFTNVVDHIIESDTSLSLPENKYIRNYIITNIEEAPSKTLTMLFIWAFHINSFDKIIKVVSDYDKKSTSHSPMSQQDLNWSALVDYLKSLKLDPKHVRDYLEIVTVYGVSGQIGAIALQTFIEQNIDVNPLIYCEVANMLYQGNNYASSQPVKAMNMFSAAANTGYGPALWNMGQMTNHDRHQSNIKNAMRSKEYYKRAFDNKHPLTLNNLGILYHRAIVFYITRMKGYENLEDCFLHDNGSGISEIYHSIKEETYLKQIMTRYDLENFNATPSDINEEYECLNIIESIENDILETYFIPGFMEHSYFYAAGSALTIYEGQFKRKKDYWESQKQAFENQKEYITLRNSVISTAEQFARYYCSESHYTYARLLEEHEPGELQNAYEHYYIAAFDTPHRAFRFHALLRFLELHHSQDIMNKKQGIDATEQLLNFLSSRLLPYNPEDRLMLRSMKLMDIHMKLDLHYLLTPIELGQVRENLITELHKISDEENEDEYKFYLKRL